MLKWIRYKDQKILFRLKREAQETLQAKLLRFWMIKLQTSTLFPPLFMLLRFITVLKTNELVISPGAYRSTQAV